MTRSITEKTNKQAKTLRKLYVRQICTQYPSLQVAMSLVFIYFLH